MFDWSGKNGDKSGKSQGILISCVSGKPQMDLIICSLIFAFILKILCVNSGFNLNIITEVNIYVTKYLLMFIID